MTKYQDDYDHFDDSAYINLEQVFHEFSERAKAAVDAEYLQRRAMENARIAEKKAHHSVYQNLNSLRKNDLGFYEELSSEDYNEEDDDYEIEETFEYEDDEGDYETVTSFDHEIAMLKRMSNSLYAKNHLGEIKEPVKAENTKVTPVNKVVSSAISVKVNSWRHLPRWVSLGTITVGSLAVVPGLITMNLMNVAITGSCLLITSGITVWGWLKGKNSQAKEDSALWKSMATKWGAQSLPEDKAKTALLDSARTHKPAKWYDSDKTYTLVYNSETRTYELSQEKRHFGEIEELELPDQIPLWENHLTEKVIPEQVLPYLESLKKTLKRLPTDKLDGLSQHQIQRIMRDSVEALNIYDALSEYQKVDDNDENLQIVLAILHDLDDEASGLIETEIAKLRNQLEVHALYVANRAREETESPVMNEKD